MWGTFGGKDPRVPDIEVPQKLTNLECLNLVQTLEYKTQDGQIFPLKMNTETIIKFQLGGQVHSSESEGSYCTQSRIKTDTGYVSSGFELIQMMVILKKIIIVSENGHRLIVKEDNLYLPNECQAYNLMCRAEHGIYMWDHNNINNCNFDFFRQATLTRVTTNVYVDHHNKILLTVPDSPTQITCLNPLRVITKTSEGV